MEKGFVIEGDSVVMQTLPPSESQNRIQVILDMINDPEESLSEINKKIAIEVAYVSAEIASVIEDPTSAFKIRAYSEQVKALKELSRILIDSEQLSKRDFLNFDGPKFQFVLTEIIKFFKKALISSNISEANANDVLRLFKDTLAVYEPVLRKETEKISGNNKI